MAHHVVEIPGPNRLLARLEHNEEVLRAFNRATLAVDPNRRITPAAEWLLDNFYLIEEQIQLARRHLPRGYSWELPRLMRGASEGFPRVYDIVLELISHVDAQIDEGPLCAFVAAYQGSVSLRLGELWAIPIMLRLGLIENLQRVTSRLIVAREDRDLADHWTDRLQAMAETNPSQLVVIVADMARANLPISSAFVAQFCQRLARQSSILHLARAWLEQRLLELGVSVEHLIHLESQSQAADQVSISHSISSLRILAAMNWKDFVESLSGVEQTLRSDPAGVYRQMDFATRDRYRHVVEFLARQSHATEAEAAQAAIRLAEEGAMNAGIQDRTAHVGYYLIDGGLTALTRRLKVDWPWRTQAQRVIRRFPLAFYAGSVGFLTLGLTLVSLRALGDWGIPGGFLLGAGFLFALCSSQLAVALVNWIATLLVPPQRLPRLDYSSGINEGGRTMVVVPAMLVDKESVDELVASLEVHHLANRDPRLHFALLTDFLDADTEMAPEDAELLHRVREGIEAINRKHASAEGDVFFLFHRPRRWNASEHTWMGYERKRGKLVQFNLALRGGSAGAFSETIGRTAILPSIQYVITLDTDTQLPRDAARQLIGIMAHPLNRPEFDPVRGVVTKGYGILQPRIGVSLPSARKSWFVRLFAGDAGIDPYTREVSDVYQDVFAEGSFTGKGIYDVDAFQRAIRGRFPENSVLSHDLLEACHARSALVSDVEFYEECPSRYNVDADRRHRWIRGDWQTLQWLMRRVPGIDFTRVVNPLSWLSQWKIFDNLRRSLVPVALMALLMGNECLLPERTGSGLLWALALIGLPGLMSLVTQWLRRPSDLPWSMHLRSSAESLARHGAQWICALVFLPYDAFISIDAVGRTLLRMLITHRLLLQWRTSRESARAHQSGLLGFYGRMWLAPLTGAAGFLVFMMRQPATSPWVYLLLFSWTLSPAFAWWISQPLQMVAPVLTLEQRRFLRQMARRTWHYFDSFVTAEENWLPPDNYQESPAPTIASRTSPTNLGLALLANLAAADFGYLTLGGLIRRTQDTMDSMVKLERFHGHFFNWYETRTLRPLLPLYVSSVDSGNLSGHLLTLGAGLRELASQKLFSAHSLEGLKDTHSLLRDMLPDGEQARALESHFATSPRGLRASLRWLEETLRRVNGWNQQSDQASAEVVAWMRILQRECEALRAEMIHQMPWLTWTVSLDEGDQEGRPLNLAARVQDLLVRLDEPPSLLSIAEGSRELQAVVLRLMESTSVADEESEVGWKRILAGLSKAIVEGGHIARTRLQELNHLAQRADAFAAMDYRLLFDPKRNLFCTGYNVTERKADASYYDLLASEARLCSYVAISLGQVPQDHWFSLGRLLVASRGEPILVSWSGSMFEYLMPMLVMPNYENTLLDHTCHAAVQHQMAYGKLRGVPWGISESGYNRTDVHLNYQYRAFGVPGLGWKRGLADDLVVAPYAGAMALMLLPVEACRNLQRLAKEKRTGTYGFYEAIDYTPNRLPPNESSATIAAYMVHHQGMILLSLVNLLHEFPMPRRFMACPLLRATELLLQERVPKTEVSVLANDLAVETLRSFGGDNEAAMRVYTNPSSAEPEVHLLSNGSYHVVISSAGGGYSRWRDLAITRWREDGTKDHWGSFVYVRDVASGEYWSAAFQPTLRSTRGYEAVFTQARAEFRHQRAHLEVHTEISVSPEDDVELRRITLVNRSSLSRIVELTSYAEVVLAPQGADATHPAFSNLFVETEFLAPSSALLCTRRARSEEERPPWLFHLMLEHGGSTGELSCETDRNRFIGRGGSLMEPLAMQAAGRLSNTVGAVLDPIVSLRRSVVLPPHATVVVDLLFGVTAVRETAIAQVEKYQSSRMSDRALDLAWTHNQVTLRHLNVSEREALLYGRLASALIYSDAHLRATSTVMRSNRRGQSALWSYGVSGDTPIVLLRISDPEKLEIVRQLIQAHSYWRMKGLIVELIIINEDVSVYRQSLHDAITQLISSRLEALILDKPGGVFVRRLEQISHEDLALIQSAARVVLDDENGSLADQVGRGRVVRPPSQPLVLVAPARVDVASPPPPRELLFSNGLGGFSPDGREYVITLGPGQVTPAPWVNVIANPSFGTLVSESGSAYTWFENSHEFRLTPWNNDPVQDPTGEAFYIRDEHTGQFWSPSPGPARGATPYVIRHGFGYTVFEHTEHGIHSELWVYVASDVAVKFTVLKVRNVSGRPRRLSVTGYWEWVLGELRQKSLPHVQTEIDVKTGALLVRNVFNSDFPDRIVFLEVNDASRSVTGDRREFVGRNGNLGSPAAMKSARLSGTVGAGLDPCGAVQVAFDLGNGQERETVFRLGVGDSVAKAQSLIKRFRRAEACPLALEGVRTHWQRLLGAVVVETPDPAVNVLANGWLLYQVLSGRLWGRTGFYQSGGAYGFRDQLQDVMALIHSDPALTREHLIRAAGRQFREGDVQHWWHPPSGRGVRTHISDDFLWLPYVTSRYVACIADTGVLVETIPYLEARPLKSEEESCYDQPNRTEESGTLYEHCVRAIERGLRFGEQGLPLMGIGDWNDGLNRVGNQGRGESVWLGFFLYDVLMRFAPIARMQNDPAFADRCLAQARLLQQNLEAHAWDGAWYRRAYFDDGTPLGSSSNVECRIDSIPQSWSVISGAGDRLRARRAMISLESHLVRREAGLIQLLDPPFDHSTPNPGYIKGYIPGVRENGGQYTHGALWSVMAFAKLGNNDRAWELFRMLNPVNHGGDPERLRHYKVEPYVVAADVYGVAPHLGRGGWTWYTGSAGWMYRLLLETLLGIQREGDCLRFSPVLPSEWSEVTIHYRFRQSVYHITLQRITAGTATTPEVRLDGKTLDSPTLPLSDTGRGHQVLYRFEQASSAQKPNAV